MPKVLPFMIMSRCLLCPDYQKSGLEYYNTYVSPRVVKVSTFISTITNSFRGCTVAQLDSLLPFCPGFLGLSQANFYIVLQACRIRPGFDRRIMPVMNHVRQYLNPEQENTAFEQLRFIYALSQVGNTEIPSGSGTRAGKTVSGETCCNTRDIDYNRCGPDRYFECIKTTRSFEALCRLGESNGVIRARQWVPPDGGRLLPAFSVSGGWAEFETWACYTEPTTECQKGYDPDVPGLRIYRRSYCRITGHILVKVICSKGRWTPGYLKNGYMYCFRTNISAYKRRIQKLQHIGQVVVPHENVLPDCVPAVSTLSKQLAESSKKRKREDESVDLWSQVAHSTRFRFLQYVPHSPYGTRLEGPSVVDGRIVPHIELLDRGGEQHQAPSNKKKDAICWVSNTGVFLVARGTSLAEQEAWGGDLSAEFVLRVLQEHHPPSPSKPAVRIKARTGYANGQYARFSFGCFDGLVHQAVAQTFLGGPPGGNYASYSVDHVHNGRKRDNSVHVDPVTGSVCPEKSNLRWATHKAQALNRRVVGVSDGLGIDKDEATINAFSPDELKKLRAACPSESVRARLKSQLKPVYEVAVLRFLVEPRRRQFNHQLLLQGLRVLRFHEVPSESWSATIPPRVMNRNWSLDEIHTLCYIDGYTGLPGSIWRLFVTMLQMKAFEFGETGLQTNPENTG